MLLLPSGHLGWPVLIIISLVLTFASKEIEEKRPICKEKRANGYILGIRFLHYMAFLFNTLYVFLFDAQYDILFFFSSATMYIHWLFLNNQCLFSYLEKRYYDEDYVAGSSSVNIYWELFFKDHTRGFMLFGGLLSIFNVIVVLFRQPYLSMNAKLGIAFAFITYVYFVSIWKVPRIMVAA